MENKNTQPRKAYAKRGERTSKMVSFRADALTTKVLDYCSNKGRLINRLIQEWGRDNRIITDDDINPKENDIEEYFT